MKKKIIIHVFPSIIYKNHIYIILKKKISKDFLKFFIEYYFKDHSLGKKIQTHDLWVVQ